MRSVSRVCSNFIVFVMDEEEEEKKKEIDVRKLQAYGPVELDLPEKPYIYPCIESQVLPRWSRDLRGIGFAEKPYIYPLALNHKC
ncbi:hypothetical protein HAX54_018127 [Datura stramonium]|uniref:Uncharacterized protein n=1 Tax=Datura stramonium TaxID=4076 RepID=A0ABS8ULQ0_DATST|nr:hypothetical protein [Datura stramonium]